LTPLGLKRKAEDEIPQPKAKKSKRQHTDINQYSLDTRKHYKIWFSKDPNIFLPQENQLRLIRMKLKNPDATISLVYSSNTLSKEAKAELINFCYLQNITPIDFDVVVRSSTRGANERTMYRLAATEIRRAIDNTGGNLAAASDIVRLLKFTIENCGIYSDFDVDVDFSALEERCAVAAPLVCSADVENIGSQIAPTANNEFLAFSTLSANGKLHKNTEKLIDKMQVEISNRYLQPSHALLNNLLRGGGICS